MELLQVEGLTKRYASHTALNDVSLTIPKGSIFGLLGPNGAGKTTLIRIITRIIEQDQGRVMLNGEEITPEMVRLIGYLPEERGLYKKMKVGEQLLYLARLKGLSRPDAVAKIKSWLKRLELTPWHNKAIEDLSKGMAQKVQFIATVLHEPELIILDEPFSGFDPVNANLIKDEILQLRDNGATVIFSTHRMESVEELCDHIALINQSEKILDGKKVDIKQAHKNGTFIVEHEGQLTAGADYELLTSAPGEVGYTRSVIKDKTDGGPNNLLRVLMGEVEIHSFIEKVPTINEIFIQKVKGGNHE
ncbi:ABC transporter ATP-binding protein [Marinoscillum furvescens]|uniref:ABC-2 type transport system ATP-binding protein n=1 Tax=Marinoscillum furvescens DSM 4134 TaxID=1122208 RepID=A0A3D9LGY3_MARFU|nr:ATP-binding cassette domain-containing protein [Marinoscillum furvescens]REE05970.1 ABC-2 type transport system ATP-binding protein [Marinoscillum furvescens DSM 4134]